MRASASLSLILRTIFYFLPSKEITDLLLPLRNMVIGGHCIETMMRNAYPLRGQTPMKDEPTGEASTNEATADWERLRRMSDADIHAAVASDPDIIPTDQSLTLW
jgi:hypothetical protein